MKLPHFGAAVFLFFSSLSIAAECEGYPEGSSPWERCLASQLLSGADATLNQTYQKLRSALSKPESSSELKMLISSQRAWISYRDKSCALVHALKDGMHDVYKDLCQSELTEERAKFLQSVLNEM